MELVPPRQAPLSAIDVAVGRRLRDRRHELKLLPESVGSMIGVSAAKIEAFETGHSRLGPKVLLKLCNALGVKVDYFFDFEIASANRGARLFLVSDGTQKPW